MEAMPAMAATANAGGAGGGASDLSSAYEPSGGSALTSVSRVRTFFPETWLRRQSSFATVWRLALSVTAPDTITTWNLDAFAAIPSGISVGQSPTALRVIKAMFVEMRMPYSARRGEECEVVVAVFNYISGSVSVPVTLELERPLGVEMREGGSLYTSSLLQKVMPPPLPFGLNPRCWDRYY